MVQGEFIKYMEKEQAVKANVDNTAIIMASSGGYSYDGFVSEGYKVYCAYKRIAISLRFLRELWFRIPLLPKELWFDSEILNMNPQYIIIRDAIITRDYLKWLQKRFPDAQINFLYENMVDKARHVYPDKIPKGIRIWTYDGYDSKKYGIDLKKTSCYFPVYVDEKGKKKYDLLFVGRDKGRGEMLLNLKKYLEDHGFTTKFVITADGRFSRKKKYYHKEVPYQQIARWISESRSILNVAMENQEGITVRDLECLFNKVKLITTNKYIIKAEFYNEKNVYILNENNWAGLLEFLKSEYDDTRKIDLDQYSAEKMIAEITGTL